MVALDPQEEREAPLLDLEIGRPEDDCKGETKEKRSLAAAFTKFFEQTDAEKEEPDRVSWWALRVFLVALWLWLYLVNLMRKFVIASGTGEGRACTAAVMVLVAFSLGGVFSVLCTTEDEKMGGAGVPKPAKRAPRPRASSSRENGWILGPNLLYNVDDSD